MEGDFCFCSRVLQQIYRCDSSRTGQLAYDLKVDGSPILYSWTSKATRFGYPSDEESANESVPLFIDFLQFLSKERNTDKINVVAHSMGNRVLARALERFVNHSGSESSRKGLNQVIFSNPDIPIEEFQRLSNVFKNVCCKGLTLYAGSEDKPLSGSEMFHQSKRAGTFGDHLLGLSGLDIVDVSAAALDENGHSAFVSPAVLGDWFSLLRYGISPKGRYNLTRMDKNGWVFWRMSPELH